MPHGVPSLPLCARAPNKAALGVAGRVLLLCGGLLSPPKGIETAIAAMPLLLHRVPTAMLLVLGAPHPGVGDGYVAALRRAAARAGVAKQVVFLSRFVRQEDAERLYQARIAPRIRMSHARMR